MTDFDSILQKTLPALNAGFDEAVTDVTTAVEAIAESIKKNSSPKFNLYTNAMEENFKHTVVRISFDPNEDNPKLPTIRIIDILIPSKGYPLLAGLYLKDSKEMQTERELTSKEDFDQLFVEMINDPDSKLLQSIGFGMRQDNSKF